MFIRSLTDDFIPLVKLQKTLVGLSSLMEAVTSELGFTYFALIHHADLRGAPEGLVNIKRYPEAISRRIIEKGNFRSDPIVRACAFAGTAFRWSELHELIQLTTRDTALLEVGIKHGLNEGITVPSHLLGDYMGSCTFAGTRRPDRVERLLGTAHVIGTFAFQAARSLLSSPKKSGRPRLYPRQRECVVLAGQGFSNKEIARALALAPRTIDGYLTHARQLFDAHDRTELVISALFAGEIDLRELLRRQPE